MSDYDIITVGGGLGGAALARSMAERGAHVLVVERETKFKDRVRGEGMTTWGCGEARELGIYDLLTASCGHETPWWDNYVGPMQVSHRDVASTTPHGLPTLAFYHPEMQRALLDAAEAAGAEVRRGAKVTGVTPGTGPRVTVENADGTREELSARLVVGADGRGSLVRKWAGLSTRQDAERNLVSGLLFENSAAPQDTVRFVNDFAAGRAAIIFPQGGTRVRAYVMSPASDGRRLQGEKDVEAFVDASIAIGMPREYFDGARAAGPLATFDGADCWVEHPYRDGVALIGDAASSSDPSWGQGLSLTVRDARVLRDALLSSDDWDAAGHAYAEEHDRYYGVLHTVEDWCTQFFYETGPEADARRARAFPLIAKDRTRMPDTFLSGPDHPADDMMRQKFFAEVA
jgi:2-polyprenyl-6-methoxyphenol hydroxylase-like FAD-dependent oxidoreductase